MISMDKHAYGEVFERRHSTSSRVTRSSSTDPQFSEDLMTPDFIQRENEVHPLVYPCDDFLRAVGILFSELAWLFMSLIISFDA